MPRSNLFASTEAGGGHEDPVPTYLGNGDDVFPGDEGRQTVIGGNGDDWLAGGPGYDILFGDNGDDYLQSDEGRGELFGGRGNDVLIGAQGPELLDGGPGDDVLSGGLSPDVLIGGKGDDMLEGGEGHDTFVFEGRFGSDIIADFECGQGEEGDTIDLSGLGITTFDDLQGHISQADIGAVIAFQGGSITLIGIDQAQLTADCFQFA